MLAMECHTGKISPFSEEELTGYDMVRYLVKTTARTKIQCKKYRLTLQDTLKKAV